MIVGKTDLVKGKGDFLLPGLLADGYFGSFSCLPAASTPFLPPLAIYLLYCSRGQASPGVEG